MFADEGPVLAMVSGGGDSVALLHLLASGTLGRLRLRVLHVNHLLRAEESDADEAFVRSVCSGLGVEVRVVRYDVAAYAEAERLNLEDAGRQIRYRFAEEELDSLCESIGTRSRAGRIAVAHTLDDRIETFFMRAIAGSGAGGLSSIAATRGRIVRPLIECARADVRAWLQANGHAWRDDASNDDTSRARAYVRAELVPAAARLNPSFRSSLARTMDLLGDDDALLGSMADAFARDFADMTPGIEIAFNRELMATLDRTMARRTVRSALARTFPEASRLEAEHVESLVDGLSTEAYARDLPVGLRAFTEYGRLVVSRNDTQAPSVAPGLLILPGTADLGAAGAVTGEFTDPQDMAGTGASVVIDADKLEGELAVDAPRPGDRMRPLGMTGTRKVSDLLVDEKVPKRLRSATPVIRDGERIVWLAGVRMSEDYRVDEGTTRAVRLTWHQPS